MIDLTAFPTAGSDTFDLNSVGGITGQTAAPGTDPTFGIDPKQSGGGDWLNTALGGLVNTAIGAGQSALNAWSSGQVSQQQATQNDVATTSGNPPQSAGLLRSVGITPTTGTGLALAAIGVAGLVGLMFVVRK